MRRQFIKCNKSSKLPLSALILLIAIVLFAISSIFIAIQTAAYGVKITKIEDKIQEISLNNNEVSEKVMNASSLTAISEKAGELGYIQPTDILYSVKEQFAAKLP